MVCRPCTATEERWRSQAPGYLYEQLHLASDTLLKCFVRPAVVIHGGLAHSGYFVPIIEPLRQAGRRVIAVDLRGHVSVQDCFSTVK